MNTKENTIKSLIKIYGENFKTPLAKDLRVDVSTIRRLFNSSEELPFLYEKAIEALIADKNTED